MKSSTLFGITGLVLLVGGLLAAAAGLPPAFRSVALGAPPCLVISASLRRRDKIRSSRRASTLSRDSGSPRRRPQAVLIVLIAIVTLSSAWWLQYTTHLSLPQRIISAVVSCITCVTVYVIAATAMPPKA